MCLLQEGGPLAWYVEDIIGKSGSDGLGYICMCVVMF